jgi:hypothetical protein
MSEKATVDIHEIGVTYVKDKSREYARAEREFDPSEIQDFELRDGELRRWVKENADYYNRDRLRRANNYPGMWYRWTKVE